MLDLLCLFCNFLGCWDTVVFAQDWAPVVLDLVIPGQIVPDDLLQFIYYAFVLLSISVFPGCSTIEITSSQVGKFFL